jgi:hypothetical protein
VGDLLKAGRAGSDGDEDGRAGTRRRGDVERWDVDPMRIGTSIRARDGGPARGEASGTSPHASGRGVSSRGGRSGRGMSGSIGHLEVTVAFEGTVP